MRQSALAPAGSLRYFRMRSRLTTLARPFLMAMLSCLVLVLVLGFGASSSVAVVVPCHVGGSDAEAREEARTAQTIAETYATDHEGSYRGLSLRALHRVESSVVTSSEAAVRVHRQRTCTPRSRSNTDGATSCAPAPSTGTSTPSLDARGAPSHRPAGDADGTTAGEPTVCRSNPAGA